MTRSDKPRFMAVLGALGTSYRTECSETMLRLYWAVLAPRMTVDQLEVAAERALTESEFFPSAAELLDLGRSKYRLVIGGKLEVWLGAGIGWGEYHGDEKSLPPIERKLLGLPAGPAVTLLPPPRAERGGEPKAIGELLGEMPEWAK